MASPGRPGRAGVRERAPNFPRDTGHRCFRILEGDKLLLGGCHGPGQGQHCQQAEAMQAGMSRAQDGILRWPINAVMTIPVIKGGDGSSIEKSPWAKQSKHTKACKSLHLHAMHEDKDYLCIVCPRNTQAAAAKFSHGHLSGVLCKQSIASAVAAALCNNAGAAEAHCQVTRKVTAQERRACPSLLTIFRCIRAAAGASLLAC